jgi:uncharacterized membrane protein
LRKDLVIAGSIITGLGAIGLWIAQTWVIRYDTVLFTRTPVHPEPVYTLLALGIMLVGLIIAIYGALADPKPSVKRYADLSDGLAILERRYALSEISREEYLEKRGDMEKKEGV